MKTYAKSRLSLLYTITAWDDDNVKIAACSNYNIAEAYDTLNFSLSAEDRHRTEKVTLQAETEALVVYDHQDKYLQNGKEGWQPRSYCGEALKEALELLNPEIPETTYEEKAQ